MFMPIAMEAFAMEDDMGMAMPMMAMAEGAEMAPPPGAM